MLEAAPMVEGVPSSDGRIIKTRHQYFVDLDGEVVQVTVRWEPTRQVEGKLPYVVYGFYEDDTLQPVKGNEDGYSSQDDAFSDMVARLLEKLKERNDCR